MDIRLIIFDFDGTLGDTRRNIVVTMQMTATALQLPMRSDDECASTIGLPLGGCFKALYPDADEEMIGQCTVTYRRIFQENLQTIVPQTFPGVPETLSALKRRGFTLAIASSRSHNSLVELTHQLGFADDFSFLVGADDVEKAKPEPEPVRKVLDALDFRPHEALVVGDMSVDILMGKRAGTATCGVTWGNGTHEELEQVGADYIIDRMEDLLDDVVG